MPCLTAIGSEGAACDFNSYAAISSPLRRNSRPQAATRTSTSVGAVDDRVFRGAGVTYSLIRVRMLAEAESIPFNADARASRFGA